MAMSGHSFWSHDIGGFTGEPTPELFVCWAQFGLLSPLSRFHGVTSRLPWDFGDEALTLVREAAELRVRLHPYLYAAASRAVTLGSPIMAPMVLDHPGSPDAQAADLQYLLGADILVAPCYRPGGRRQVWFPPGRWLPCSGRDVVVGPGWRSTQTALDDVPAYLRVGAVLPTIVPRRRVGDSPPVCEELVCVVGNAGAPLLFTGETNVVLADGRVGSVSASSGPAGIAFEVPAEMEDVWVLLVVPSAREVAHAGAHVNGRQVRARAARSLATERTP